MNNRPVRAQQAHTTLSSIIIPCSANVAHNDLSLIVDACAALPATVSVTLLGSHTNVYEHMFTRSVRTFDSIVPEDEYVQCLESADMALLPQKPHMYGAYKISGAWGDCVAYGIPLCVHTSYANGVQLPKGVARYDSPHTIVSCIHEWRDQAEAFRTYCATLTQNALKERFKKQLTRTLS